MASEWLKDYDAALLCHSGNDGGQVNFMSGADDHRVPATYSANQGRLAALKATRDSVGLFHINQIIAPAIGAEHHGYREVQ